MTPASIICAARVSVGINSWYVFWACCRFGLESAAKWRPLPVDRTLPRVKVERGIGTPSPAVHKARHHPKKINDTDDDLLRGDLLRDDRTSDG